MRTSKHICKIFGMHFSILMFLNGVFSLKSAINLNLKDSLNLEHPSCRNSWIYLSPEPSVPFSRWGLGTKRKQFPKSNFSNIECKKCTKQYIGETKRQLHERFGEHRRSIQNHHQLIKPTPVSTHFNQPGHSIDHLLLTPLELIQNTRDSVRKHVRHIL